MKSKKWVVAAFMLLLSTNLHAWDMQHPKYKIFADSDEVAVLSVDSADLSGQTLWIDTTYFPSVHGKEFGWVDQLLIRYGISGIDATPYPEGDGESDSGHSLLFAVDVDSGHIGLSLETTLDGLYWQSVWEDSTIRAVASSRSTHSAMLSPHSLTPDTAMVGGRYRLRCLIYHDVDSTESDLYNLLDSVWLDKIEVWGFGYDE